MSTHAPGQYANSTDLEANIDIAGSIIIIGSCHGPEPEVHI